MSIRLKLSKTKLTFLTLALLGLVISVFAPYILPEKYFWDSNIIIYNKPNFSGLIGSFPFTIWFYKVTGLKHLPNSIIAIIQYTILVFILYKIGIPKNLQKLTIKNIIIYLMFFMLAIYVSVPAKEFINFIYIALIVFLYKKNLNYKYTVLISIALLIFFGYFFRPYFLLIAILSIILFLGSFLKIKNYKIASIVFGLVILIGMSLSYGILKGQFISEKTRDYVNDSRIGSENARTMIVPPLDNGTWYGETFGIVYGFFSVNLPINGLKYFLSPQIIAFTMWQLLLFCVLIIKYGRCIKEGKSNNYELWLFYILFSYFIVQGVFEPDLGSALRHKASMFPIIFYLLNYEDFRRKI